RLACDRASVSGNDVRWRHWLRLQDLVQHLVRRQPAQLGIGFENQAMRQDRVGKRFHIVWGNEVPPLEGGAGLRGSEQAQGTAGTGSQANVGVRASPMVPRAMYSLSWP